MVLPIPSYPEQKINEDSISGSADDDNGSYSAGVDSEGSEIHYDEES